MTRILITALETVCIYDYAHMDNTTTLFSQIDNAVMRSEQLVTVDLKNVKMITAAASLLLFAITNKCQLLKNNENQILFEFPSEKNNPQGHGCIVKTGLARALRSGNLTKLQDLVETGVFFQSAINPSVHIERTVEFLTKKAKLNQVQFQMLTTAITEAMLNVSHHAYKDPLDDKKIHSSKKIIVDALGERWWQCAWYDEKECKWVFIIVDLGLGIPFTYDSQNEEVIPDSVSKSSTMLEAFTVGNSRFDDEDGRGNGSENIKEAIDQDKDRESLLIYSGGVRYLHNTSQAKPDAVDINFKFRGTLIEWTLCLGGES